MDVSTQGTSLCEEHFVKQEKEDDCIVIEDDDTDLKNLQADGGKLNNKTENKTSIKRKKRSEEDTVPIKLLSDVFLRVIYPLTQCMSKNVIIGVFKHLDYAPGVLLNQGGKYVLFTDKGWHSLSKYLQLIECYIINNVYGKKTSQILAGTDIEVENLRLRGSQCVRFRDLTKFDDKVLLYSEEFQMLSSCTPAIERYLQQLTMAGPVIKDYLQDSIERRPSAPLLYGEVDTCVYNRLPQEIHMCRRMSKFLEHVHSDMVCVDHDLGVKEEEKDEKKNEEKKEDEKVLANTEVESVVE